MSIESIQQRAEYPGIIRITDETRNFVDWRRTDDGTMIAGFVYIMTYQPGFTVHLFMPYQHGSLPELLRIEDNRGPDAHDLKDAVPPQASFTPLSAA